MPWFWGGFVSPYPLLGSPWCRCLGEVVVSPQLMLGSPWCHRIEVVLVSPHQTLGSAWCHHVGVPSPHIGLIVVLPEGGGYGASYWGGPGVPFSDMGVITVPLLWDAPGVPSLDVGLITVPPRPRFCHC